MRRQCGTAPLWHVQSTARGLLIYLARDFGMVHHALVIYDQYVPIFDVQVAVLLLVDQCEYEELCAT